MSSAVIAIAAFQMSRSTFRSVLTFNRFRGRTVY